ncbi:MAG: hypothetical protein QXD03_05780 [Candidatus Anstonellales archaeon]
MVSIYVYDINRNAMNEYNNVVKVIENTQLKFDVITCKNRVINLIQRGDLDNGSMEFDDIGLVASILDRQEVYKTVEDGYGGYVSKLDYIIYTVGIYKGDILYDRIQVVKEGEV